MRNKLKLFVDIRKTLRPSLPLGPLLWPDLETGLTESSSSKKHHQTFKEEKVRAFSFLKTFM
jgi:hypothetical protein